MSWQRPNIGSPPLPAGSAAPVHSQSARLGAAAGAKCHCVCQVGTSKQGHSSRNRLGSFCQNLTLRLYLAKPHPTIGMARRRARRSNWKFGFILPFCQKHVSDCILSDCILVSLQLDGRLVNGRRQTKHIRRSFASRVGVILGVYGVESTTARRCLRTQREA